LKGRFDVNQQLIFASRASKDFLAICTGKQIAASRRGDVQRLAACNMYVTFDRAKVTKARRAGTTGISICFANRSLEWERKSPASRTNVRSTQPVADDALRIAKTNADLHLHCDPRL